MKSIPVETKLPVVIKVQEANDLLMKSIQNDQTNNTDDNQ